MDIRALQSYPETVSEYSVMTKRVLERAGSAEVIALNVDDAETVKIILAPFG